MLTEQRLIKKISLTYDEWQDWLYENTPDSWDVDSTMELLAYYGFAHFMIAKENIPDLDLEKLDKIIFGSPEESKSLMSSLARKLT